MTDPFPFDPLRQRYPSQRFPLYARGGMVNCSSPQAAAAGLEVLRKGGNAVDAAVAAAAALTVVEPTANGIGSDAFALVWSEREQKLFGLNSSGPAPQLLSIDGVMADGRAVNGKMPVRGWTPVTVSGAPGAWAALNGRFGRLTLSEDLSSAVPQFGRHVAAILRHLFQDPDRVGISALVQNLRAGRPGAKGRGDDLSSRSRRHPSGHRRKQRRSLLSGGHRPQDRRAEPPGRRLYPL